MSKRVLIISDSVFRQTGYSTVTKSILDNIDPSFKIAQLGVSHFPVDYQATNINIDYYSPIMKHENDGCGYNGLAIEHYNSDTKTVEQFQPTVNLDPITGLICKNGMGNPQDAYNFDSAFYVIEHFKPDIVIAINDIWGMYKLAFLKNRSKFKLISYLAVDSECFPVVIKNQEEINTMQFIENVDKLIVFTKWAKRTINTTAQIALGRKFDNIEVIEHGVDLTKFNNLDSRDDIIDQIFKLDPKKVLYMGDDIPDFFPMQKAGLACCPADASNEIKGISDYISPYPGGKGCVRDVIEQVLKLQDNWMTKEAFQW